MRRACGLLCCLVFGCAFDDGFEDRYSGGYPGAGPQVAAPPVVQQGWQSPAAGAACATRSGVIPAAYSPPSATTEPPR